LNTQKERIQQLQSLLQKAKSNYSTSLKNLEMISESIHKKRGDLFEAPPAGIREPGVGAESHDIPAEPQNLEFNLDDVEIESRTHSRSASQTRPSDVNESEALEALRMKVKSLAVRPIEGGDGKQDEQESWESELNATVDKLDCLMLLREKRQNFCPEPVSLPQSPSLEQKPIKQLKKVDPLPLAIVSLQTLPTSNASPLNSKIFSGSITINCDNLIHKKKRKLSLQ
jgi:SH3-domain binding protein 5